MAQTPAEWAAEEFVRVSSARWFRTSDTAAYVGTKHHTVPKFVLRRFAEGGKRLSVWRRTTKSITPGNVDDLAITNFYTVLNTDGQFDGRMEELLGQVETAAAPVIDWLQSPYRGRRLSPERQAAVCQFLAFQLVRGPRKRKEIELEGDYGMKLLNEGSMTEADLRDTTFMPHPNEHIRLIGSVSEAIFRAILPRPVTVIQLDAPLLVITDEPVLIDIDNHVKHLLQCSLTVAERVRLHRHRSADKPLQDVIHVWPTKPSGVQSADAIAMPISPQALVALGPAGQPLPPVINFKGAEARDVAAEVNAALIAQAYEWVAANPGHPEFATWTFPEPGPLIGVCDGGTIMSQELKTAPVLKWQRIRKDWAATNGESPATS